MTRTADGDTSASDWLELLQASTGLSLEQVQQRALWLLAASQAPSDPQLAPSHPLSPSLLQVLLSPAQLSAASQLET